MKEKLQKAGYKLTQPRKDILNWLKKPRGVFSAKEILEDLSDIDKVSVYRTLELLADLDLIHPVLNQHGEVHYEKHPENHHHHAVCSKCEKTACIDCDVKNKKVRGFTNLHHSFVITGLCVQCA